MFSKTGNDILVQYKYDFYIFLKLIVCEIMVLQFCIYLIVRVSCVILFITCTIFQNKWVLTTGCKVLMK